MERNADLDRITAAEAVRALGLSGGHRPRQAGSGRRRQAVDDVSVAMAALDGTSTGGRRGTGRGTGRGLRTAPWPGPEPERPAGDRDGATPALKQPKPLPPPHRRLDSSAAAAQLAAHGPPPLPPPQASTTQHEQPASRRHESAWARW